MQGMEETKSAELQNEGAPDSSSIKPVLAQKQPPPETPESVKTRRWIIFSFWAVAAVLGLPVWIWTTTVHRAVLPLDSMNNWADGKVGVIK